MRNHPPQYPKMVNLLNHPPSAQRGFAPLSIKPSVILITFFKSYSTDQKTSSNPVPTVQVALIV